MVSGNPVLNDRAFQPAVPAPAGTAATTGAAAGAGRTMTLRGTVNRTAVLFAILLVAAGFIWTIFDLRDGGAMKPWMFGSAIAAAVCALVTVWKREWSPFTAPLYAVAKGLFVGSTSAFFESKYPGVVLQAVMLTLAVMAVLLLIYRTGIIKVTKTFRLVVLSATGAIVLLYLVNIVMRVLGYDGIGFVHEATPLGIAFSLLAVTLASLNLVLDFDSIERGVARGAPQYMEWFAGFGLLVTLVWLYIEFLRLFGKVNRRNRA
jgi:uncharacterized YccA/Bax inhibitor family protein